MEFAPRTPRRNKKKIVITGSVALVVAISILVLYAFRMTRTEYILSTRDGMQDSFVIEYGNEAYAETILKTLMVSENGKEIIKPDLYTTLDVLDTKKVSLKLTAAQLESFTELNDNERYKWVLDTDSTVIPTELKSTARLADKQIDQTVVNVLVVDTAPPVIKISSDLTIKVGQDVDPKSLVNVSDPIDGVLDFEIKGTIDSQKVGIYPFEVKATDSNGLESNATFEIVIIK